MAQFSNDQWTLDLSGLGFQRTGEELLQLTLHCTPPFAICVSGRWGSGKTSVMRYAMTKLGGDLPKVHVGVTGEEHAEVGHGSSTLVEGLAKAGRAEMLLQGFVPFHAIHPNTARNDRRTKSRLETVWFSPWRHQADVNPMIPLLHAIRRKLSVWAKTRGKLSKLARATVETGLDTLGSLIDLAATSFLAAGGVKAKVDLFGKLPDRARKHLAALEEGNLDTATPSERFNLLFEYAVGQVLGVVSGRGTKEPTAEVQRRNRLVIFIDDLDRCEAEATVRMLEAIKLYLSTRHCVFVLGVDEVAVRHALTSQWKDRPTGLAAEYLAKLFQAVVYMPVGTGRDRFVHRLLVNAGVFAQGDPQREEPTSELGNALAVMISSRPRHLKNFVNGFAVAWTVARAMNPALADEDLNHFALLHRLRHTAPASYQYICQHPDEVDHLRRFLAVCTNPDAAISDTDLQRTCTRHFLHDFAHILPHRPDAGPEEGDLPGGELRVRLHRSSADYYFANGWVNADIDEDRLRHLLGAD